MDFVTAPLVIGLLVGGMFLDVNIRGFTSVTAAIGSLFSKKK